MKTQTLEMSTIQECKKKLISLRADLMNRVRLSTMQFAQDQASRGGGGDEIDQTVAQQEEHTFLVSQERLRTQLLEIELALGRIENGNFGICEETEEPIEPERLMAIPWTRLSIEGAELREAMSRKFAR